MKNANYIIDNQNALIKPEEKKLKNIFLKIFTTLGESAEKLDLLKALTELMSSAIVMLFSSPEKKNDSSKENVNEKIEGINRMISFLNNVYYSKLEITKEEKKQLISLIDYFQNQKELIEITPDNLEDTEERIQKTREHLSKKMQSSFSSESFLNKLNEYLDGNLGSSDKNEFLIFVKEHPHLLHKVLKYKKYREKIKSIWNLEDENITLEVIRNKINEEILNL